MGSKDLENTTNAALDGAKGKVPTTIKLLAMEIDRKFESIENRFDEKEKTDKTRHEEVLKAISDLKCSNDAKFKKLSVVMFFSDNPKLLVSTIIGAIVITYVIYLL